MNTKTVGSALCLLTACVLVFGQTVPKTSPDLLKLLDGYTHKKEQGRDTRVGQISKPDRITLRYDIGRLAGNYAESTRKSQNYLWYKEQTVSGHRMQVVLTKEKTLIVSVPDLFANFYGPVKKEEDIADALLMLATYPATSVPPADKPDR